MVSLVEPSSRLALGQEAPSGAVPSYHVCMLVHMYGSSCGEEKTATGVVSQGPLSTWCFSEKFSLIALVNQDSKGANGLYLPSPEILSECLHAEDI